MRVSVVAVGGAVLVLAVASAAAAKRAAFLMPDADVVFGDVVAHPRVPDFLWDDANKKLKTRSIMVAERSDPAEIGFRRTGPDNADDATPLAPLEANRTVGLIYAQTLTQQHDGGLDYDSRRADGSQCFGRTGEIAFRATGPQTPESRPGEVTIATTRPGDCDATVAWRLMDNGQQDWSGQPTHAVVGNPRPCALVRVRFFDGTRERDGYVPLVCG